MNKILNLKTISLLTILLIFIVIPETTYARPGGGHSYENNESSSNSSSNSGSGSSSYSSDDTDSDYDNDSDDGRDAGSYVDDDFKDAPLYVKILSFAFMLAVLAGFSLIWTFFEKRKKKKKVISKPTQKNKKINEDKIKSEIIKLKEKDPNFSKTLFLDFASSVYTKFYNWQLPEKSKNITPFIDYKQDDFKINHAHFYNEIVIGSINLSEVKMGFRTQMILVEFNANYTLTFLNKKSEFEKFRELIVERCLFIRDAGVMSQGPKQMQELACPNCGANAGFTDAGQCESCNTLVKSGDIQWYLAKKQTVIKETFETKGLAHYSREEGTKEPTIYQKDLVNISKEFASNHNIDWNTWSTKFNKEVANEYFIKLYNAWSTNKLDSIRNLLSDRLYNSWIFWIDNYKKEGLTNKLKDVTVKDIHFVKLETDKFYESATVRVFASAYDYVENSKGVKLGGSIKRKRHFSEYWTFIRRTGVEKDTYDYGTCPNCGAPADKMGQSGICKYCNSKISNGDFSWVLSIITQDEVYKG